MMEHFTGCGSPNRLAMVSNTPDFRGSIRNGLATAALCAALLLTACARNSAPPDAGPYHSGWTFQGVRLVDCHDGDTCTFVLPLPAEAAPVATVKVRLRGLDAPELRGDTLPAARAARDALLGMLRQARRIDLVDYVHYGGAYNRELATVLADGVDVAAALIAAGHAVPYSPD